MKKSAGKNIKILVVDDEESIRKLMTYILRERGFIVRDAGNGEEALDRVAEDKPDIILLDLAMPRMNGLQAYERLREDPSTRNIPVIFLSARFPLIPDFKNTGLTPVDYIEKPCDIEYLVQRIEALTSR
ncbi:MAG: response regulator [Candidatus Omnitrophica bacterium]|nr:response regulator [Candidatus Omnitrophota bacterium]MDD5553759.1 response regulator [Candidatus Omnitrophota bacterium]